MDVRCERCQTEYELEDETIAEGGVPVQCTSCGHTFFVSRPSTAKRAPAANESELPAAEWLLETSDGQLHRFRNLTSLQKWIIERKVTREDKISRTGHAWRRLGEIVELGPFFDVVDEADRARAGEAAVRDLKLEAAEARRVGPRPSPVRAAPVVDSPSSPSKRTPSVGPRPTPSAGRAARASASSDMEDLERFAASEPAMEPDTHVVVSSGRASKVVTFVVVVGAIAGAGVFLLQKKKDDARVDEATPGAAAAVGRAQAVAAAPGLAAPAGSVPGAMPNAPPTPAPVGAPAAGAAVPAAVPALGAVAAASGTPSPTPTAATPAPAAAPTPSVAAPPPVAVAAPAPGAPATSPAPNSPGTRVAAAQAAPVAATPPSPEAPSYERLVAEADRLLENGATDKASKLYDKATKLRPSGGAEAIAGLGYVALDRGRAPLAESYFRKALGQAPSYAPAMFGLAEAFRTAGDDNQALESYRRYLTLSPSGPDANAAERQIKTLETRAKAAAPAPASAPSSTAPPPSSSSVLGASAPSTNP